MLELFAMFVLALAPIIAAAGVIVCAVGSVMRALLGHGRNGRDGSVNS